MSERAHAQLGRDRTARAHGHGATAQGIADVAGTDDNTHGEIKDAKPARKANPKWICVPSIGQASRRTSIMVPR